MKVNAPALLARVRELARVQLGSCVAAAVNALPDDLNALAAAASAPAEQRVFADAAIGVPAHGRAIAAAFESSLVAIFNRKLQPAARKAPAPELNPDSLALVDDDAMELELALGRLARKMLAALDPDQLAGVGARLGALAGGGALEGPANPLGPETALEALKDGCAAVPAEGPVHMTLVDSLQPHVAAGLRKLCAELNAMLIAEGVLPRIRHAVQRVAQAPAARGAPGGAGGAGAAATPGLPPGMSLSQAVMLKGLLPAATSGPVDLGAILGTLLNGPPESRQYGARMLADPDGSIFAQAMATPVDAALLAELTTLQGAVTPRADLAAGPGDLHAVVQNLAHAQPHPLDRLTGELVAVVFDYLLHDRDIPDGVKAEIARLQIVAFKAALLDRSFFASREHPLRELLIGIAEAASDPQIDGGPEGRFVTGLRAIVDDVLARFAEDLGVVIGACERLAALVAELGLESEQEVEALASNLAGEERAEVAPARAAAEVARRIAAGQPTFVQRFLTDAWVHVLADAEAHGRTGDDGWDARLKIVDDLLWSLEPKQATDVPRLTALLPKLVPALGCGMKAQDIPADAQRAFLDELMQRHTALLQGARMKRAAPALPPPARPPQPPPPAVIDTPEIAAGAMLGLARGAVIEFADVEPPVRAKLSWISPQQTLYLFTGRGVKARRMSPRELSARIGEGKARLVEAGGAVIDRALAAVAGEINA